MLRSLQFRGLLSFGPEAEEIQLRELNVLIGPNGSGKSNLIEGLALLRSSPKENGLFDAIREGGGAGPWFWRGTHGPAELHAIFDEGVVAHRIDRL